MPSKNKYYLKNKEKMKKQQKQWKQKNRVILHSLKINGCAICGYNKCDNALDFHHANPKDKKFNVNLRHAKDKNLVEEMQKCILLCSNCHREIHTKERDANVAMCQ